MTNFRWESTGGNPGGFIAADDVGLTATFWFRSPTSWGGNWRQYIEGTIEWDIFLYRKSSFTYYSQHELIINTADTDNYLSAELDIIPVMDQWTHFKIDFTRENLTVHGSLSFDEIIQNVESILIRGEYGTTSVLDAEGLDNVRVTSNVYYCRDFGPCDEGEGDCDIDSECQSGLTCVQVPGTDTCQDVCDLPVGHLDYCQGACGPCGPGDGDCDSDSECEAGLTCVQIPGTDTCQSVPPPCPPVGHLDYCLECGPSAEGEGDCDNDGECESGLTCAQVIGTDYCQKICPPVGHLDYCHDCGPCSAGEGDCDNDSECQSGLACVQVTGTDVCCPHPLGHLDYCHDCGPCAAGQGDCDNDGECQSGLTCVQVTGTDTCQ